MINQISWMLVKNINRKLFSGLLLMLLFVPTVANAAPGMLANANNAPQLNKLSVKTSKAKKSPKRTKKRRRREAASDYSRAGGSRGCPSESIPLTVLAPNTFVGKTTSVRPTFTWFASKAQPTEFRLYELDANTSIPKRIGAPISLQSTSGINQFSLPEKQPGLTVGQRYIWQVSIDCPGSTFIQRAEFRVVQKPSALDDQLSRVVNSSQKAYIYAEQDLWYEALEEAVKVTPQRKLGQVGSDMVQKLAQSDNFIPKQLTPDRLEVFKQEIQQRRNYLEKIVGGN